MVFGDRREVEAVEFGRKPRNRCLIHPTGGRASPTGGPGAEVPASQAGRAGAVPGGRRAPGDVSRAGRCRSGSNWSPVERSPRARPVPVVRHLGSRILPSLLRRLPRQHSRCVFVQSTRGLPVMCRPADGGGGRTPGRSRAARRADSSMGAESAAQGTVLVGAKPEVGLRSPRHLHPGGAIVLRPPSPRPGDAFRSLRIRGLHSVLRQRFASEQSGAVPGIVISLVFKG